MCGSFTKELDPQIGSTASHLAPDRWIRFSTTQHWSVNRLSLRAKSSSLERAHRNGNVQHQTSCMMMMMIWLVHGLCTERSLWQTWCSISDRFPIFESIHGFRCFSNSGYPGYNIEDWKCKMHLHLRFFPRVLGDRNSLAGSVEISICDDKLCE